MLTDEKMRSFFDDLHEFCQACKHCKPGTMETSCVNEKCMFWSMRNIWTNLKRQPKFWNRFVDQTTPPPPIDTPTKTHQGVNR